VFLLHIFASKFICPLKKWREEMAKKLLIGSAGIVCLLFAILLPLLSSAAKTNNADHFSEIDEESCYGCHDEIRNLQKKSKHANLSFTTCGRGCPLGERNGRE
jgi:hypothetical protein